MTGKILSPLILPQRIVEDFVENLDALIQTDPATSWRLVTDNLNTHCSQSLVRYIDQECKLEMDLGVEGNREV